MEALAEVKTRAPRKKTQKSTGPGRGPNSSAPGIFRVVEGSRSVPAHTLSEPALPRELNFADVYRMEPLDRISFINTGVEAEAFTKVAQSMRRSRESVAKMLGLALTTLDRKLQKKERLSADQSERLVAAAKLIGQVQTMVDESGQPEGFDAAQWFADWLERPLMALGGRKPAALMNTAEGRDLIARLLATAQSGAYV
ncbi:MAG: DUF2384 domain-containing protein [Pigmentiphaga sp.]|nr:DUF2384 domain-containing protein [Pigmentiphaga sp.]